MRPYSPHARSEQRTLRCVATGCAALQPCRATVQRFALRHNVRCGRTALRGAGVAKGESLADTIGQTGFKGTPAFMSPEQLKVRARTCARVRMYLVECLLAGRHACVCL